MSKTSALVAVLLLLIGCGGGSTSPSPPPVTPPNIVDVVSLGLTTVDGAACAPTGSTVTITGTVNYERVPFSATAGNGLDFNNIQTLPVRGAVIQALGNADCVIATGTTSNTGAYSITVAQSTTVKIRVKVQTLNTTGASWDFEVRDNTNSSGLYVLDGQSLTSGTTDSVRTLTATTGWGGTSYTASRNAAPFAILDSVYTTVLAVVAVDSTVIMDDADIFWSVNNSTASGTLANGEIGDSFYSNDQIYLLGLADSDTDEFDQHVIIHEWGHYFEDNLSRSDSIGGAVTVNGKLDLRAAFSEGFGNAFAAMILNDPIYRDSSGAQQGADTQISVETNASTNVGWFSQSSVQTILYDISDATADANDNINLGFAAIYNAMTSTAYTSQSSLTSIFPLINQLKSDNAASAAAMDTLAISQGISTIVDSFGTNETNNGGDANDLPVYKILADDGFPVVVCSAKTNGEGNRLGNRQLLRLNVVSAGSHTISVTRISGLASSDPDVRIYLNGTLTLTGTSSTNNSETVIGNLNVDEYIVEVYDINNIDNAAGTGGSVCFNIFVF